MEEHGYIKLFRRFLKWEWIEKPEMVSLFIYLLLMANHEDGNWQGVTIKKGEVVVGRNKVSRLLGISSQSYRSCIRRLKSTNEITTKSTNKFTIIYIVNWDKYQEKSTNKSTNKSTFNQPTTNQQLTTDKKRENEEKEKKIEKEDTATPSVAVPEINSLIDLFKNVNPSYKRFFSNKTERSALTRLLEENGRERVIDLLEVLVKSNSMEFAPQIFSPSQLEKKLGALLSFINKEKLNKKSNIVII